MRKFKCLLCKNKIEETPYIIETTSKTGKKTIKRYHKQCFLTSTIKRQQKDDFYKYIQENFFPIVIPTTLFIEMSMIKCNYDDILECCRVINLVEIISKIEFNNDMSKSKYIAVVIRNHINTYVEKKHINEVCEDDIDVNDFI